MRSALFAAAFAAGALAVPYQKRDVVTDVNVVYVTDLVTVTANNDAVASTKSSSSKHKHHRYTTVTVTTVVNSSTATSSPTASSVVAAVVAPHPASTKSSTSSSTTQAAPTVASPTTTTRTTTKAAATTTSKTTTSKAVTTTSKTTTSTTKAVTTTSKTTTSSAAAVKSSTTAAAASASPSTYQQLTVFHHNIHRANHSAPNVAWSDSVAATAAKIAASCVYAHNTTADGGGYGQNIAAGVPPNNISAVITDLFYNGEVNWFNGLYGQAQPDMTNFEHWGHFSQIVWKDTSLVGCATQDCTSKGLANVGSNVAPYFTVCNYVNPGNYANEYGANIGSPLGNPTASWNQSP